MLQSGASTTPAWSTTTYPATNAINTLLYASSANTMSALATANNGVLVTSAGGVPSIGTTLPTAVQTNITSLGTVTTGTIAIAGTISTTNTTASTSTGTGALTVTGGAGIGGALYSATVHTAQVVGTSATPTVAYGVGAGTGAATVALIGNQMAFYLQFNTGTGPTTGVIFTITVPTATGAFGAPPILVPQSTSAVTQTGRISIALTSTTTWTATAVVALSASTNYAYYVVCPASF